MTSSRGKRYAGAQVLYTVSQTFRYCIAQTISYPVQKEGLALDLPRMGNVQPVIWIAHEGLIGYQGHELFKLLLKPGRRGAYRNEGAEKPLGMRPDHC
jgi:hypothetical protein